jgi:hypothetical protein
MFWFRKKWYFGKEHNRKFTVKYKIPVNLKVMRRKNHILDKDKTVISG